MFLLSVALPHVYFKGITSEFVMYSDTEGGGQRQLGFFLPLVFFISLNICTLAVASITMVAKSGPLA